MDVPNGNGIGQDDNQAITWFRKSADLGNFNAIKNLAYWYMYGTGTTQDYAKHSNCTPERRKRGIVSQ